MLKTLNHSSCLRWQTGNKCPQQMSCLLYIYNWDIIHRKLWILDSGTRLGSESHKIKIFLYSKCPLIAYSSLQPQPLLFIFLIYFSRIKCTFVNVYYYTLNPLAYFRFIQIESYSSAFFSFLILLRNILINIICF